MGSTFYIANVVDSNGRTTIRAFSTQTELQQFVQQKKNFGYLDLTGTAEGRKPGAETVVTWEM